MTIARRALWAAGLPARAALIAALRVYRAAFSGLLGGQCRFYPSCSAYAEDAVRSRGAVVGAGLAAWRVLRCNPFGTGGVERVADRRQSTPDNPNGAYEDIIHDVPEEVTA